jgi:hypothetical protein
MRRLRGSLFWQYDRDGAATQYRSSIRLFPVREIFRNYCGPQSTRREPPSLSIEQIARIKDHKPADQEGYRAGRIAEWSHPRYAIDKRFVNLAPCWTRERPTRSDGRKPPVLKTIVSTIF